MTRVLGLLVLFGVLGCAQPAYEIRGRVLDASTGFGIVSVQVTILRLPDYKPGESVDSKKPIPAAGTVETDVDGRFSFRPDGPGTYNFVMKKDGYSPAGDIFAQVRSARLDATHATAQVTLNLAGKGTITGRVLDAETGEPMAGALLQIGPYRALNGRASIGLGSGAKTEADGSFRAEVAAGTYLIVFSLPSQKPQFATVFTPEDAERTDSGYRPHYFPGGPDFESVVPLQVATGTTMNAGTLRVQKETFHRLRVRVAGDCAAGESILLSQMVTAPGSYTSNGIGKVACGEEVLLHDLPSGPYEVFAIPDNGKTDRTAFAPVTIGERNPLVTLSLTRRSVLTGRVVPPEGGGPLDPIKVFMEATDPAQRVFSGPSPAGTSPQGEFQIPIIPGPFRVRVQGLGNGLYMKEIRYGGLRGSTSLVEIRDKGELEIVIERGSPAIRGNVVDGSKPVAGADVVLAFDGEIRHVTADADGHFEVTGIIPGEYRIFGVRGEEKDRAQEPFAWTRLLADAQTVKVGAGNSNIEVKLANVLR